MSLVKWAPSEPDQPTFPFHTLAYQQVVPERRCCYDMAKVGKRSHGKTHVYRVSGLRTQHGNDSHVVGGAHVDRTKIKMSKSLGKSNQPTHPKDDSSSEEDAGHSTCS